MYSFEIVRYTFVNKIFVESFFDPSMVKKIVDRELNIARAMAHLVFAYVLNSFNFIKTKN